MTDLRPRLTALFERRWPEPRREDEPAWQGPGTLREPLYHHWRVRKDDFSALLDINTPEALLGAAMMCVPEGEEWTISVKAYEPCLVTIPSGDDRKDDVHGQAPSPAEALVAAIEQAMEVEGG